MIGLMDETESEPRVASIHVSRRQGDSEKELVISSRGSNMRIMKELSL
jgi:hypothetical protein